MDWLEKMNAAIAYIESHLDQDISYEEAAKIACCSTYYFQRLFSYVIGVSLSEYIRRRRMTQAAFDLQRTHNKVMDIALKYGYTSATSFHRAFSSVHNMSPTQSRHCGSSLNAYPAVSLTVQVTGAQPLSYHIEEKEAIRIVGFQYPITPVMEENHRLVPQCWKNIFDTRQFAQLLQLSNHEPNGLLGVTIYHNDQSIDYMIAVSSTQQVPKDMASYDIPAHTWVVFENNGDFKGDVQNIFKRFMSEWLPFSGYEYAGLPDIEIYPIQSKISAKGHFQVMIAIRERKEKEICII